MTTSAAPQDFEATRVARVVGWLLMACFCAISTTHRGFYIDFLPPFTRIGMGEANLWLSSALLVFPAACLLGYGYRDALGQALRNLHAQLEQLDARERKLGLVALTLIAIASARLCNALILRGYPVTDDEWAVRFGGEVLASGQLATKLPFDRDAYPTLFSFIRDGKITSFDWIGLQIPWAIAALTGTGNWVFALLAAAPVPAITWLLTRRLSASWGVLGALLFLMSPMAFALSMTMHGHLSSRAWIAVMLAIYVLTRERDTRGRSFALGFALGSAMICRPYEVCFMFAPLFVADTWQCWRHGDARARAHWGFMVLGLMLPVAVFFVHAYALTGGLMPARHHELQVGGVGTRESSYWVRFGSNSAYNALRLAVWFAGPFGIAAFAAGALFDRFTRFLSLGVASTLVLGLFHDNYGVHAVGPIHYSECVVPLVIVSVHGVARVTRALRSLALRDETVLAITAAWMVLGLGTFDLIHGVGMHEQARAQSISYDLIEEQIGPEQRPAVLFAPRFGFVWQSVPELQRRGTWVYEWKRPKPDFSDDILILHDNTPEATASVHAAYPHRHYFHMQLGVPGKIFEIVPDP